MPAKDIYHNAVKNVLLKDGYIEIPASPLKSVSAFLRDGGAIFYCE
jgi:hypothetical protein